MAQRPNLHLNGPAVVAVTHAKATQQRRLGKQGTAGSAPGKTAKQTPAAANQQLQQQLEKMRTSYEQRLDRLEKGNAAKAPSTRTGRP